MKKDIGNAAFLADADREWERRCDEDAQMEAAVDNYLEGIEAGDFIEAVKEEFVDLSDLWIAWKQEDWEKAYNVIDRGLQSYAEYCVREQT